LSGLQAAGSFPVEFLEELLGSSLSVPPLGELLGGAKAFSPEEAARVERFLGAVRPWAIPTLLELLATLEDRAARRIVLKVLEAQGGVPGRYLVSHLGDPRWFVVRNAVRLAAISRDPTLVPNLGRLLRHPDARVRREAVRTLEAYGGRAAATALSDALADTDSSVRTLAASALGHLGGPREAELVLKQVEQRDFADRPVGEVEAFLNALARLDPDRAVPVLDRLWRRRRLRSRPLGVRVAALGALALADDPRVEQILREAVRSSEDLIRPAANRALATRVAAVRVAAGREND
ncbi:MAG: HEAT repeat domain-containing protein, partial [Thermoleophilia bacterium]|nr:HEAT repeat domain-containing protein [Thermoleophilia bacterium]